MSGLQSQMTAKAQLASMNTGRRPTRANTNSAPMMAITNDKKFNPRLTLVCVTSFWIPDISRTALSNRFNTAFPVHWPNMLTSKLQTSLYLEARS